MSDSEKKFGVAVTVVPAGENLVSSWRKIVTNNGEIDLKTPLDKMNKSLNISIQHSRVTAWEQGNRQPGQKVINYMMKIVLKEMLGNLGVSNSSIYKVINSTQIALIKK